MYICIHEQMSRDTCVSDSVIIGINKVICSGGIVVSTFICRSIGQWTNSHSKH